MDEEEIDLNSEKVTLNDLANYDVPRFCIFRPNDAPVHMARTAPTEERLITEVLLNRSKGETSIMVYIEEIMMHLNRSDHPITYDNVPFAANAIPNTFLRLLAANKGKVHGSDMDVPRTKDEVATLRRDITVQETIVATCARLIEQNGSMTTDEETRKLEEEQARLEYKYALLYASQAGMTADEILFHQMSRTTHAEALRSLEVLNGQEPNIRGPPEVAGKNDFSQLCVSSKRLFKLYTMAYAAVKSKKKKPPTDDPTMENTQSWQMARADYSTYLSHYQPDEVLTRIGNVFSRSKDHLFPPIGHCDKLTPEMREKMEWDGRPYTGTTIRVIPLGLIPIVLAFFDARFLTFNDMAATYVRLTHWIEELLATKYVRAEHKAQLDQFKYNCLWVQRRDVLFATRRVRVVEPLYANSYKLFALANEKTATLLMESKLLNVAFKKRLKTHGDTPEELAKMESDAKTATIETIRAKPSFRHPPTAEELFALAQDDDVYARITAMREQVVGEKKRARGDKRASNDTAVARATKRARKNAGVPTPAPAAAMEDAMDTTNV
jgi:hypothetical protein